MQCTCGPRTQAHTPTPLLFSGVPTVPKNPTKYKPAPVQTQTSTCQLGLQNPHTTRPRPQRCARKPYRSSPHPSPYPFLLDVRCSDAQSHAHTERGTIAPMCSILHLSHLVVLRLLVLRSAHDVHGLHLGPSRLPCSLLLLHPAPQRLLLLALELLLTLHHAIVVLGMLLLQIFHPLRVLLLMLGAANLLLAPGLLGSGGGPLPVFDHLSLLCKRVV
mmetsp:Transcript_8739/g.17005  ORF Transcript_8739/g.17005 Transcript_8739/m.17005 type:complete len:217 (+) Transcript_8739:47-697(+)